MLNTPEKRRQLLIVVVGLIVAHLYLSGRLINCTSISDPNLRAATCDLFAQYKLLLSGK